MAARAKLKFGIGSMKYIKQLDSIRAIAVILVFIEHWIPKANLHQRIPYGKLGVDVFFVLSGFLISRISLRINIPWMRVSKAGRLC